jgi:hypothetical protein
MQCRYGATIRTDKGEFIAVFCIEEYTWEVWILVYLCFYRRYQAGPPCLLWQIGQQQHDLDRRSGSQNIDGTLNAVKKVHIWGGIQRRLLKHGSICDWVMFSKSRIRAVFENWFFPGNIPIPKTFSFNHGSICDWLKPGIPVFILYSVIITGLGRNTQK